MRIPLSRGMFALVDDEDFDDVMAAKWHAHSNGGTGFYARATFWDDDGNRFRNFMHRFLTGWSLVDHKNGNGLDNRRSNLRRATIAENARNRRLPSTNTSGFKGVMFDKARGLWRSHIGAEGRRLTIGRFTTPEEAARAYDEAAREMYGEFAWLNFPDETERPR